MTKQEFIHAVRQFIADGKTDEALTLMRERVSDYDTSLVTDATMLESRYTNAFNDFTVKNILPREDYDRTVAQINYALLEIVEKLEKSAILSTGTSKNKSSGRILHNIPGTMPVGKERRCIVRIAYDDETLLQDLEKDENTTIQDIRIAEVMGVELVDFNETPAFSVRTITEEEQFTSEDDFTQWLFMVKALREGKYPLTLKVSVIEEVNGKERKRDIVLEKEVFIISQLEEEQPAPAAPSPVTTKAAEMQPSTTGFEDSTIRLNYVATEEARAVGATSSPNAKRFSVSGIASTIAILAMALTGWVAFNKFGSTSEITVVAGTDDKSGQNGTHSSGNGGGQDTTIQLQSTNINNGHNSQIAAVENKANPNDNTAGMASYEPKEAASIPAAPPKYSDKTYGSTTAASTSASTASSYKRPTTPVSSAGKGKPARNNSGTTPTKPAGSKTNTTTATTTSTKPSTIPKISIGEVTVSTADGDTINKVEPAAAEVKTYKVRLILKGEMKKAQIFVDGQPVDQYLKKNIWGTPQYIEFKSSKTKHTITFKKDNVSCSVTDVLIEDGNMTVEPCSFEN